MDKRFTQNLTRPTCAHPYLQVCYGQLDFSLAKNTKKVFLKSGLYSKIEFQLLSYQSKIQWMVNGRIIREPNSYGRTTDLSKTLLARPMLTPIYKYAIDNWI